MDNKTLTYHDILLSDFLKVADVLDAEDIIDKYIVFGEVFLKLPKDDILNMELTQLMEILTPYFNLFLKPLEPSRQVAPTIKLNEIEFEVVRDFSGMEFGAYMYAHGVMDTANNDPLFRFKLLQAVLKPKSMKYTDAVSNPKVQAALNCISVQDAYDVTAFFLIGSNLLSKDSLSYLMIRAKQILGKAMKNRQRSKFLKRIMGG